MVTSDKLILGVRRRFDRHTRISSTSSGRIPFLTPEALSQVTMMEVTTVKKLTMEVMTMGVTKIEVMPALRSAHENFLNILWSDSFSDP